MSQKSLEILGEESIAPSLLKSDDSELIASVGSIAVEDSIPVKYSLDPKYSLALEDSLAIEGSLDSEYSLDLEDSPTLQDSFTLEGSLDSGYSLGLEDSPTLQDSLDSKNSILSQEIEVDSLTGVANDPTAYGRGGSTPRPTTGIKNAWLQINVFSYNNQAQVIATVDVSLSPYIKHTIEEDYTDILLNCTVWGIDGGIFGGGNDYLFNFSEKTITTAGRYTFSTFVNRRVLNEDPAWFNQGDEIAAEFKLTSSEPGIPVNYTAWTNTVTGRY